MHHSTASPLPPKHNWVYASITVVDGDRQLKPSEVAFDRLVFNQPPHLLSDQVEVIVTNGDAQQRQMVNVLPHDPDATRIPIRLVPSA